MSAKLIIFNLLNIYLTSDHSILRGVFKTTFFNQNHNLQSFNSFSSQFHQPTNLLEAVKLPPRKNQRKITKEFFMSDSTHKKVIQTIDKIENSICNQNEVNLLWDDVKQIFSDELCSLPDLPSSSSKGGNRKLRKSQPFWNEELSNIWKDVCKSEKEIYKL